MPVVIASDAVWNASSALSSSASAPYVRYNFDVASEPLGADTSPEIERLQIERFRQMTPAEKAAIVTGLTQAVYDLAAAGVRHRYPHASPREQFLRLAIVTLGQTLAEKAYPEIQQLGLR